MCDMSSSTQRSSVFVHDAVSTLDRMLYVEREAVRSFLEERHEEFLQAFSSQVGTPCNDSRALPLSSPKKNSPIKTKDIVYGRSSRIATATEMSLVPTETLLGKNDVEKNLSFSTESCDATRCRSARSMSSPKIRGTIREDTGYSQYAIVRMSEAIANSDIFEQVFGILIILNSCVMCFEAQYWGHDSAHLVEVVGSRKSSDVWPYGEVFFRILDILFGIIFTCEVVLKVIGLRRKFVKSWWNFFDTIIIVSWMMYSVGDILPLNPFFLRLMRLARLVRLLRLVKTIRVFDILHLMAASLIASVYVLFWSVVLLLGIMTSVALMMVTLIGFYIEDASIKLSTRQEAYEYFGNFSRSLLSVFEITLGNWAPLTRFLHEEVSEYFGIAIMAYHCVVSFAVVMVIRGVFLHETFQAAEENDELLILRQRRRKANAIGKMQNLFSEADTDMSGSLTREEFTDVMRDSRVNIWLAALGLEVRDAQNMFEVIDDGDGNISAEEFINGFARLKGPAKSIDMVQVLRLTRTISDLVHDISVAVGVMRNGLEETKQIAHQCDDQGAHGIDREPDKFVLLL